MGVMASTAIRSTTRGRDHIEPGERRGRGRRVTNTEIGDATPAAMIAHQTAR